MGERYRVLGTHTETDVPFPVSIAGDIWVATVEDTKTGDVEEGTGSSRSEAIANAIEKLGGDA